MPVVVFVIIGVLNAGDVLNKERDSTISEVDVDLGHSSAIVEGPSPEDGWMACSHMLQKPVKTHRIEQI